MRARFTFVVVVLLASAVLLPGCPGNQAAKYKLYVCVTAPFPDYTFSQLVVSPVSKPNGIDQTDSLSLTESNVLELDGLVQGESYDLAILTSTSVGISWNVTGKTGIVDGDILWLIYEDGGGALQHDVHALPVQRTLKP